MNRLSCMVLALAMSCGSTVISTKGLSTSCSVATDCVAVYLGDVCDACECPFAAIATSSKATYDREVSDASKLCGPRLGSQCLCPASSVSCESGSCVAHVP